MTMGVSAFRYCTTLIYMLKNLDLDILNGHTAQGFFEQALL